MSAASRSACAAPPLPSARPGRRGQAHPDERPLARLHATGAPVPMAPVAAAPEPRASASADSSNDFSGTPLDVRLTFSSFVVGRSNALAHAAAERIARHQGEGALYNPLYLHAGVASARRICCTASAMRRGRAVAG